ncbi:hypothetical protein DFJ73DRAFT_630107, partial [Zopfochytrium polystomum]
SVSQFRRLASKVTSPAFGPAKCQWEIALYPDGQGATRGTHIGIFLDVVKSDHELRLADAYSRPILSFRISVLRKGVSDDILAAKERDPFNADGFGAGFMHPKSWGWAAFLPVAKLDEALTPSGAIVVQAEVVWHAPAEVSAFLDRLSANAAATAVSNERLLFSDVMSDVVFLAPDFVVDSYGGEFGAAGTNEESCDVEGEEDADRSSLIPPSAPPTPTRREPRVVAIPAHRAILASRSDYYLAMFTSGLIDSSSTGPSGPAVVRVTDFSAASIRWMLEFLYTGGIRHKPTTRAQRYELLRLADRYQLGGLHDHIASLICDADLTLETMTEILELGDRYGSASPALRTACLGFIRDNAAKLKASESFKAWVRSTDRRDLLLELFTLL